MSEKKLRKSERRKLRRKNKILRVSRGFSLFLILGSFIFVVCYVAYISLTTGTFNIKEILVEGTEILSDEQIVEASGIELDENIFLLDTNEARYKINQILSAKEINIQKVLPDKIIIKIDESEPLAVIHYDSNYYYINDSGNLMEVTKEFGNDLIPLITGFKDYEFPEIGESIVVEPQYKFEMILNMLKLFERNGLEDKLSEISITDDNSYRIITKNGVVFLVKDFSNLKEYFDYVSTVIENGETNQEINLISGDNPIKKPR